MNKIFGLALLSLFSIGLSACGGCPLIAGCNGTDRSPYFISPVSSQARGIPIPPQTKLTYQSQHFRQSHQQTHALKEQNLTGIALPENTAILWGGMPVEQFIQYIDPAMKGFFVYPARGFKSEQSNAFLNLWKSCESDLSIYLKKTPMTGHLIHLICKYAAVAAFNNAVHIRKTVFGKMKPMSFYARSIKPCNNYLNNRATLSSNDQANSENKTACSKAGCLTR